MMSSHRFNGDIILVDEFAVKGDAQCTEEQSCVLIRSSRGMYSDVATWDHLGRVPVQGK